MSDKEYKITEVQKRKEWSGNYGTFQDYALRLEGIDGWVSLSQKPETPEPQVGQELYGHTETQTHGDKTYLKFKKVQKQDSRPSASTGDMAYVVQMLEELTGRRDRVLTTEEFDAAEMKKQAEEPIDLAEIPF